MITDERLQEIKNNVLGTVQIDEAEDIWDIANELITALEAAQAELASEQIKMAGEMMEHIAVLTINTDLRAQLAEVKLQL